MRKVVTLNNGRTMPVLGLGTWRMDSREDVSKALVTAIDKCGYLHIDTAAQYKNEGFIGEVLNSELKHVERSKLFITSKLWPTNHRPENVRKACERSLKLLQTDYLDLFLIHWPVAFKHTNLELDPLFEKNEQDQVIRDTETSLQMTWKAMEQLVDDGLVRSIGVCNFSVPLLYDLMTYARIKPVCNQVEVHPYLSQKNLIKVCHETLNIQVVAYRPLAYGPRGDLLQNEQVIKLSEKHKKTPTQIVLRWALQCNLVVIPKSSSEEHLRENMDIFDFELDGTEMQQLDALNKNLRMCNPENSKWNLHIFE